LSDFLFGMSESVYDIAAKVYIILKFSSYIV